MPDTPAIEIQEPGGLKMIAAMGTVGLVASVLLVATFRTTAPVIERNRAEQLEQAVFSVLPDAARKVTYVVTDDGRVVPEGEATGLRVHAGYDGRGALVGFAVEAQGQGFQDVLRLLYGYVPDCECITGMKVLESKETPGLGDKIEKDPAFVANFEALDARLGPDGERLEHDIALVKPGQKTDAWQVEAITGATVSSRAVAEILDRSAAAVVPVLTRHLDRLRTTDAP